MFFCNFVEDFLDPKYVLKFLVLPFRSGLGLRDNSQYNIGPLFALTKLILPILEMDVIFEDH